MNDDVKLALFYLDVQGETMTPDCRQLALAVLREFRRAEVASAFSVDYLEANTFVRRKFDRANPEIARVLAQASPPIPENASVEDLVAIAAKSDGIGAWVGYDVDKGYWATATKVGELRASSATQALRTLIARLSEAKRDA